MRRTILGLLAALAVGASTTLVAAPAQAAPKPVTIKKISNKSIDWYGTALVKPNVKKIKKVTILKRAMTIKQGGKVLRKNRTAVKLKPGAYVVTTKITYKYKGKKRGAFAKQRLIIKQGRCATVQNLRTLKADPTFSPDIVGDSVATVSKKLRSAGEGDVYTPAEILAQLEALKVLMGDEMPEIVALLDEAIAELKALQAKGVTRLEDRMYEGCGKQDIDAYATFANGELLSAEDDSDLMGMSSVRAAVTALR
ncbi:hypothetical protein [Aeromicrobium choanae]|uniref:Uncharacterized protein n=1 Tax=Aeromicrobium choanae TaxID=1736691 RepID=A0A1T4Z7C1_9ACTN|nr:hypothetical protein [Aeromicrobium choanae]SKB09909.1 hypothetical protein SAMN06295964_2968 [Aeromicrobium choanae]